MNTYHVKEIYDDQSKPDDADGYTVVLWRPLGDEVVAFVFGNNEDEAVERASVILAALEKSVTEAGDSHD